MTSLNTVHAPALGKRMEPAEVARLFKPRSIAVVGASANPERFSGKIIPTLLRQGYQGAIYPINPSRASIGELPCYPDLASIPGDVDCVVYALAAEHIAGVLDQCPEKNVRLMVVSSAGFAERGDEIGDQLQQLLVSKAAETKVRVLGPNCIGFINLIDRACVTSAAALSWPDIPSGRIGLVSQSGGLGLASILYGALEDGVSFSHVITTGNEADLDTIDVARFLVEDDDTDVLAMTVEAVRDPDGFRDVLKAARRKAKPVVILKSGRTDLGKTMAASHTGALAGSAQVFESVCQQYGAICANDIDDFYQIASMFAKLRRSGKLEKLHAPARQCAALSISGGHIGLFADHASLEGLAFPEFSVETKRGITEELGFEGNFQNPLDTTARTIGDDGFWGRCTQVLLNDERIQLVVPIITVARSYEPAIRDFIRIAETTHKAIVVIWAGGDFAGEARKLVAESNIPVFRTPARAAAAIHALNTYCELRDHANSFTQGADADAAVSQALALLEQSQTGSKGALTERESKQVLAALGLPVTLEYSAEDEGTAVAAAQNLGFPIVLKGEHPDVLHKSDLGLVFLNLRDEDEVRLAFRSAIQRLEAAGYSDGKVLVQQMVSAGTELILGITSDPEFGPVVVLGLGGIFVEVLKDVSMRVAPFGRQEALNMIAELRGGALLNGVRGQPAIDREALADLLVKLGQFAYAARDKVREADINPLVLDLNTGKLRALDALLVLKETRQKEVVKEGA
ncbi:MAG TPA: acetate--CoA ligase family protein [Burkholderiaceae bacterium]|nr:acetate--CoA ligase family protein [Burkholderiaceae bacterium]